MVSVHGVNVQGVRQSRQKTASSNLLKIASLILTIGSNARFLIRYSSPVATGENSDSFYW